MSGIVNCWIPLKGQPLAVRAFSTYSHIQLTFSFFGGAGVCNTHSYLYKHFLAWFPPPKFSFIFFYLVYFYFLLFSSNPTHPKRLNSNAKPVSIPPPAPRDRHMEGTQVTLFKIPSDRVEPVGLGHFPRSQDHRASQLLWSSVQEYRLVARGQIQLADVFCSAWTVF